MNLKDEAGGHAALLIKNNEQSEQRTLIQSDLGQTVKDIAEQLAIRHFPVFQPW